MVAAAAVSGIPRAATSLHLHVALPCQIKFHLVLLTSTPVIKKG
jgi:hypothetical protein